MKMTMRPSVYFSWKHRICPICGAVCGIGWRIVHVPTGAAMTTAKMPASVAGTANAAGRFHLRIFIVITHYSFSGRQNSRHLPCFTPRTLRAALVSLIFSILIQMPTRWNPGRWSLSGLVRENHAVRHHWREDRSVASRSGCAESCCPDPT